MIFFKNFYLKLLKEITSEILIAFFLVFHLLFPIYNITRVAFVIPFNLNFIFFLWFILGFLDFIFKIFPDFHLKLIKSLFGGSFPNLRFFLSFGPLF